MTLPPAISRLIERIQKWPAVIRLLEVMAAYGQAGDGLLASGLAYSALFAALTGLLFVVGLLGFVITDPTMRESAVEAITNQVPPLAPIVREGLAKVVEHAGAVSMIGLAGLGWSASQFYGAIDGAFARIFNKAPTRGALDRILRGIVAVVIVVVAIAAGIVTSSVQAVLVGNMASGTPGDAARLILAVGTPLLTVVLVVVAVALTYRLVPNTPVPWRSLVPPALVSGLLIAALTEAFVFIAPRLVGALEVFGTFAAVFAAMTWLSWTFQALLLGAAWTSIRLPDRAPLPGPSVEELGRLEPADVVPGTTSGVPTVGEPR